MGACMHSERSDRSELDDLLQTELASPVFAAAYQDAAARADLLFALVTQRRSLGLSQTAVARAMGTTQSAVSELEGGASDPRLSTLQRYARAIGGCVDVQLRNARVQKLQPRPAIEP